MIQHKPSEVEADMLTKMKKVISVKLTWKVACSGWRLRGRAFSVESDDVFDVHAYIGRTNYSFSLLYNNYPIRKFTKHTPHKLGGILYEEPHKHVWNGVSENFKAYVPEDICPEDDINKQFFDFCHECNIEISGEYQAILNT